MTSSDSKKPEDRTVNPDQILEDLGGCGKYQLRMSVIVHAMKTIVCFSFTNMIIVTQTPNWYCVDYGNFGNGSDMNSSTFRTEKKCSTTNGTSCKKYEFDEGLHTIVSEFDLLCDKDYLPSTINSIQVAGILVGNVIAGQLADLFGRKPTLFASVLIVLASQIAGYFSVSWQMFAVAMFFAGSGGGFLLATMYCLLSEFTTAKWRVWITGFPSWPIEASLYCLAAWLLHDWKYLQLCIIAITVPCFFAWFVIPESFRWYLANNKTDKARAVIQDMAKCNKRPNYILEVNGISQVGVDVDSNAKRERKQKKYTIIDLFRTKELIKVTFLQFINWFALGLVSYGIGFGIQTLSGNIFLNTFLFSLTGIPSKVIALWLQNRFGRRISAIICYVMVTVGAIVVGIVQTLNVPHKNELTNAFALFANTGITTAWGPVQTMTIELYPTVVRNVAFGSLSLIGRIGAIAGPQLVYLDSYFPGLLFYVCGGIGLLCVAASCFLPETRDAEMPDLLQKNTQKIVN